MKQGKLLRRLPFGLAALLQCAMPARLLAQAPGPTAATPPPAARPPASRPPASMPTPPTLPPALLKVEAAFQRALKLQKQVRPVEAVAAYKEFLTAAKQANIPPVQTLPAYLNLSVLYRYLNNAPEYENALKQIVSLDPKNAIAYSQLAALAVSRRQWDLGKQYADRSLAQSPPAVYAAPAHFARGAYASTHNRLDVAAAEFGLAAKLAPNNPDAQYNYGLLLLRLKKYKPALVAMERAQTLAPAMTGATLYIGALKQQLKDFPGARDAFTEVLKREPRNTAALTSRAYAYQQIGTLNEAISDYLAVLEITPKNFDAQFNLGLLYSGLGNFTAARTHYAAAHALQPKETRALTALAGSEQSAASVAPDPKEKAALLKASEAHFKEASASAPTDPQVELAEGNLYEKSYRYDDALALYRKVRDAHPTDIEAYRRIARVQVAGLKTQEAVQTWQDYRKQKPDDPTSYASIAQIYEAQAKWEPAIAEWRAFLERKSLNGLAANVRNQIAGDYVQLKRNDDARKEYQAVLALDATGKDAPTAMQATERTAVEAEQQDARRGLSKVAEGEGKTDEAVTWLRQVKEFEAKAAARTNMTPNPATFRAIARLYQNAKRYDLAADELLALAKSDEKASAPYADLARLYETQDAIPKAVEAWQAAVRHAGDKTPQARDYRLQLTELYRRHNRMDDAIAEYEALRRDYPKETGFYSSLAQVYEQRGQDDKALALYVAIAEADPAARYARDRQAVILTRQKHYPEARAIYEAEQKRNPDNYGVYGDLARLYAEQGQADAFLPWTQKQWEASPNNQTLMGVVIDEFAKQKREDAGWNYLRETVNKQKGKTRRQTQETLARLLSIRNRPADALAVYAQIAGDNPNDLDAQIMLADQYDLANDHAKSEAVYLAQIARADVPDARRLAIRRQLAQHYQQQNKNALAIAQYQEILKAEPKDYVSEAALAYLLKTDGHLADAIPHYVSLTQQALIPPVIRAQFMTQLALIYEGQGRKDDAAVEYRSALKLRPGFVEAENGLTRLGVKE